MIHLLHAFPSSPAMYLLPDIEMKLKRSACDRCHSQKLRCPRSTAKDGSQKPCIRCQKAGTNCTVSAMQKTGRPRKKGDMTSRNKKTGNDTLSLGNDSFPPISERPDHSTVLQLDTQSKVDCAPPSTTAPEPRSLTSDSFKQRLGGFASSSNEYPMGGSESNPSTGSLNDYTCPLPFDDFLMDMPDVVDEQNFLWVGEGVPPQYERIGDIFTGCAETPEFQVQKNEEDRQEGPFLANDTKSEAAAQEVHFKQINPLTWEGLPELSSKSTSCTDLSSFTTNSCPLSPMTFDTASPKPSTGSAYKNYEIDENAESERNFSLYQMRQQESCLSIPHQTPLGETSPFVDPRLNSAYKSTQGLLQIQFEIYASSAKFMSWKAAPSRHESPDTINDSQSESMGNFFSTVENFISLISEPQSIIAGSSSPQISAPCLSASSTDVKTTTFESTDNSNPFSPSRILKPTSAADVKSSRSSIDVLEPDLAAFHLVLACHTRLMAAYEAIVDAVAIQHQSMGNGNPGVSSVASLSIDGFMVQCGTSLESHLHLQIIVHQLERLSEACYGYLSRAPSPNSREDIFYFNSLRGLHQRRRRAAPATFMEMAKRMVEEREITLRAKIDTLACGLHHASDVDPFHFATDAP